LFNFTNLVTTSNTKLVSIIFKSLIEKKNNCKIIISKSNLNIFEFVSLFVLFFINREYEIDENTKKFLEEAPFVNFFFLYFY
jgi:hypothetical protein